MIVYDLVCASGHRFEGWFASSAAFDAQAAAGLVGCAVCGSSAVTKAVMAPAVGRKGNQQPERPARGGDDPGEAKPSLPAAAPEATSPPMAVRNLPPAVGEAMARFVAGLATAQAKALENSTWVGRNFAEEARAIHYGETPERIIHGETSPEEARALAEEGVPCSPLPLPVAPPDRMQ
mgnify:CR=1 FL=1